MRQSRIYQDTPLLQGETITLSPDKSHYIANVLRMKIGMSLTVFNGEKEAICEITALNKKAVMLEVKHYHANENESPLYIHLVQALCKSDKMDWIIQKSVECGVNAITPITTEYSDVHYSQERMLKKLAHWQGVITSAAEQSERLVLPTLHPVTSLNDAIAHMNTKNGIVLHPRISTSIKILTPPIESLTVFIGPEGGFSESEIIHMTTHAITPVSLGARILRTETAAVACLATLQTLLGDF